MERNFTETLGAGATVVLDPKRTASLFDSSIPIKNMHELEWLAYYIDPPRWPAAVFGAIKPDLAAAGERIFRSRCAGCHEYGDDRRTPTGLIRLRGMRPEDVGHRPDGGAQDLLPGARYRCARDPAQVLHAPRTRQLLKDCAGVKAGTRLRRHFLRQDRSGRRGRHQAEGLRGGRNRRGAAAGDGGPRPTRRRHLARHAARH